MGSRKVGQDLVGDADGDADSPSLLPPEAAGKVEENGGQSAPGPACSPGNSRDAGQGQGLILTLQEDVKGP
jgi:hypothetical protein